MKRVWLGKRTTLQILAHHLLVDIIPILLMLGAMAIGMALVSSKLTFKPFFSGSDNRVEQVS